MLVKKQSAGSFQTEDKEAGQKLASEYKKTSISAVGDTRFPMSWVIIKKTTRKP